MEQLQFKVVDTGSRFAEALATQQYDAAYVLLTADLQHAYPEEQLRAQYEQMIAYGTGPARADGHTVFMEDWPAKQPGDLGWLYVSLSGSDFAEAVTVIVTDECGLPKIREIAWGRP